MIKKTVVILCGGHGSRVKKYFPQMIKPLFLVEGIPIIERIIAMFKDYTIFINCNVEDSVKLLYLHLPLLIEKERIGNAGALYYFRKQLGKKFVVIHCDELTNLQPDNLWEAHDKNDGCMTMVIKNIRKKKEFGLVITQGDKIITCTKDRFVNTGIYCVDNRIFNYVNENKFQDLDNDIFPKLIENNYLAYYVHKGYWQDIGTEYWIRKIYGKKNKN